MLAPLCRGVASRAPRYALARAPARGIKGLPAGESASLLPLRLGLGRQGERGRRRHPRGCRAPWPRRSPPPTRGCRRWARRISPSRSLSRSCLLTPRAQVCGRPGARGPHTVRTSGYPAEDWPPTTTTDVPSNPIAAEPLSLPRNLLPTPSAWLEGRLQRGLGRSAVCAGEPLVDRRLSLPPPPLELITARASGCSQGHEGPRRGVGCVGARVCRVRGQGLGWLVGLALVGWAGECSQRGKLHEMVSRSFHCDRLLPLPPSARPKPGSFPLRTCAPVAGLSDHGSAR